MLIRHLLETTSITEVKMSYSSLLNRAAQIEGALVGMEFEMYVPGVQQEDREPDYEPDYDQDGFISTNSWNILTNDVVDFFIGGDFADLSRRDVVRILDRDVRPEFDEWVESAWQDWAQDELEGWYLRENPDEEELPPRGSKAYDRAMDDFREEQFNDWFEDGDRIEEWLESARIDRYSSFGERYGLAWPHMRDANEDEDAIEMSEVARAFSDAVDMPVDHGGGLQTAGRYMIDTDGSLNSQDSPGYAGLEFISPPLSIAEMIAQLEKVKRWAGRIGAYTNDSTGLHINVSLPGYSIDRLDYVKLALFLGDDWVSSQFDRLGNRYAASSIKQIQARIRASDLNIAGAFQLMKSGLAKIASNLIHSGHTEKYVTINTKKNRIEFRSPGGDWLEANYDKIIQTMLRFVVAMDIALDPEKERQEYAKKLYKLISSNIPQEDLDTVKYFAQYSSGSLPSAALKSFVRNIRQKRTEKKLPSAAPAPAAGGGPTYVLRGRSDGQVRYRFSAPSPVAAERIADAWAERQDVPVHTVRVELEQPESGEPGAYRIYHIDRGAPVGPANPIQRISISAPNQSAAIAGFDRQNPGRQILAVEPQSTG
jgi:hypothetical protein